MRVLMVAATKGRKEIKTQVSLDKGRGLTVSGKPAILGFVVSSVPVVGPAVLADLNDKRLVFYFLHLRIVFYFIYYLLTSKIGIFFI